MTRDVRHFVEGPLGPVSIEPVVFCHEGGGPHRSCPSCLAVIEPDGGLVHARRCGAVVKPTEVA